MDFEEIDVEYKDTPFDPSGHLDLNNPRFGQGVTVKRNEYRGEENDVETTVQEMLEIYNEEND